MLLCMIFFTSAHIQIFFFQVRNSQTPEEGRRSYRPKRCGNNNNDKDEDNSPKTLNDRKLQHLNLTGIHLVIKRDKINKSLFLILLLLLSLLETESLPIAAQNKTVRTNYIKARIDKTQQNSKCRLRGDRDETINHIISEFSKLAQKEYKTRHDWVGKVIHWEMCKKFKFDHTNKWYM